MYGEQIRVHDRLFSRQARRLVLQACAGQLLLQVTWPFGPFRALTLWTNDKQSKGRNVVV